MQISVADRSSLYDVGAEELRRISSDENAKRTIESTFAEARGRETARLHVTLKALTEADRREDERGQRTLDAVERVATELEERASHLAHLIESFEQTANGRFNGVHDDLRQRAEALAADVRELAAAERDRFESMRGQMGNFQNAVTVQVSEARQALAQQQGEGVERLSRESRESRDMVLQALDSRMNQADASFAAMRGDIEVVKFLVMDLIKDRIGRSDPKTKAL